MSDQLTEVTRRAVWLARAEMDELGHSCIGSVQLLVGILRAGGPAGAALRSLGLDPDVVIADARRRFTVARRDSAMDLPTVFGAPEAQVLVEPVADSGGCLRVRVSPGVEHLPEDMDTLWQEILAAGHCRVIISQSPSLVLDDQAGLVLVRGLEMLQISGGGLVLVPPGETPGIGTGLLGAIAVCRDEPAAVRLLSGGAVPPALARWPETREHPMVPMARRAMAAAATAACEAGDEFISTGHLLLGLTLVPGLACDLLEDAHGVQPQRLRAAVMSGV